MLNSRATTKSYPDGLNEPLPNLKVQHRQNTPCMAEPRIHIRSLVFLQAILTEKQSILYKMALRHVSTSSRSSRSWFSYVDDMLI